MKTLIIAAGYATRLYPLTKNFPKPLLEIGGKTILHMLDGLYAGYYWDGQPEKWTLAPFGDEGNGDWPSSIFGSLDPVAIDSVGYDFLLAQWPDVVATGGTMKGAEELLTNAGYNVVAKCCLLNLKHLNDLDDVVSLIEVKE